MNTLWNSLRVKNGSTRRLAMETIAVHITPAKLWTSLLLIAAIKSKGMLTIFKWPKHLIVLNFVNSGITINKMAKVFITLIS